uniref:Secreted protein n=1 Tax=Mola mola TaxID=94237 RepID=A0A3Q3X3Q1_MOLML
MHVIHVLLISLCMCICVCIQHSVLPWCHFETLQVLRSASRSISFSPQQHGGRIHIISICMGHDGRAEGRMKRRSPHLDKGYLAPHPLS